MVEDNENLAMKFRSSLKGYEKKQKQKYKKGECLKCGQKGHYKAQYPSKSMNRIKVQRNWFSQFQKL